MDLFYNISSNLFADVLAALALFAFLHCILEQLIQILQVLTIFKQELQRQQRLMLERQLIEDQHQHTALAMKAANDKNHLVQFVAKVWSLDGDYE